MRRRRRIDIFVENQNNNGMVIGHDEHNFGDGNVVFDGAPDE